MYTRKSEKMSVKQTIKQRSEIIVNHYIPGRGHSSVPLTLKIDRATRPFLKIDMRHEAYIAMGNNISDMTWAFPKFDRRHFAILKLTWKLQK